MLFSSNEFLFVFLPIAWMTWRIIAFGYSEYGIISLALISLIFYACDQPQHVPLMILVSIVGYFTIRFSRGAMKWVCASSGVIFLLGLLAYFKYLGFLKQNLLALGVDRAADWHVPALPIGISFFVLEAISSIVDKSRIHVGREQYSKYLLFISFFPHLVAGPIVRLKQLTDQFQTSRMIAAIDAPRAFLLIAMGLFMKVGFADRLAPFVDEVYGNIQITSGRAIWLAVWAYSLQIYFDFNGYCVMAVGVALLFGIHLPFNFAAPYKADSIIEFWRRWNISLSTYLRDYVYYPLGGRGDTLHRWVTNLMLTMLLSGLWHGAGWTFLIWGALHGFALVVAHCTRLLAISIPTILGWIMTISFVTLAWIPFRADSVADAWAILSRLTDLQGLKTSSKIEPDVSVVILVASCVALLAPMAQQISDRFSARPTQVALVGFLLGTSVMFQLYAGQTYSFIYFRF